MSTAVNTGRKAVVRRRTKTTTQAAAAQYKIAIKYILCGALLLLGIVFMAAYSTNLQQQNNTLAARNDVLQAEIDSLNEQINDGLRRWKRLPRKSMGWFSRTRVTTSPFGMRRNKEAVWRTR